MGAVRAVTTFVTTCALVIGVASVGPAEAVAETPDPAIAKIVSFLDDPTGSLQSWSQGLGDIGKLADALPAVLTSPGAALGFDDLLDQAFDAGSHKISAALHDDDLNFDEPISISGDRSGSLSVSLHDVGSDKDLHLDLKIGRDLLNQPLSVGVPIGADTNAPQSAFSSTGGVKLHVDAELAFDVVWDSASNTVYLKVDDAASTPKLAVDAHAEFADKTKVHAAIGILGVGLADDNSSDLSLDAHLVGTVSDPNNDGRLAFENPDHTPGELAQSGSLAGLVSFGFASPAGSLHGDLHLQVAASSTSIPLPAVDATISVDWPDIATGTPNVTTSGLPSVGKFLNMTPADLAVGIAQLITSLTSIQRAKSKTDDSFGNLDLPFLKGTLADAIQLNESLKKFLAAFTYPAKSDPNFDPATDDPAKAGQPKFVSLQGFFDGLNTVLSEDNPGAMVSGIGYDDATSKLNFTLTLKHDPPAHPVDLNAAAAASSGPASSPGHAANTTYTTSTLVDPNQNWTPNAFQGRHVVAGNSGATIVSNTATTLTLDSNGWAPAVPQSNEPYSISGMQGDVGVVSLGNGLQTPDADTSKPGHGIANANAVNATAKVTPSYEASVTLVLDLRPPVQHDPPIEQTNPDGSTVLVSSTPTGADRVLLRTSDSTLFTADFPIDAGVDIFANAGFLQTRLTGSAHVCQTDAPADCSGPAPAGHHMLEVDLKDNGDITFGQLVSMLLHDPKQLLDVKVNIRGAGTVTASVPGAEDFFPGGNPTVDFHWNDITDLSPSDANGPHFDFDGLSRLAKVDFDPSNPRALFSVILKTLQTLDKALGSDSPSGLAQQIFSTKIPVLGRSLGDLLKSDESGVGPQVTYGADTVKDSARSDKDGQPAPNAFPQSLVGRTVVVGGQVGIVKSVTNDTLTMASPWATQPTNGSAYTLRSQLDDVISILENSPSDNMQQLITLLNDRLGHDTPITFAYADGANVGNNPSLVIKLNWKRSFHTSAPLQFDFKLPIGDQQLAGVQGAGSIAVGASGDISLGLVVPLQPGDGPADGAALQVLDDSAIDVNVDASVENGSLTTSLGPLSLSVGDPKGSDKAVAKASYSLGLGKPGATGTAESFTSFLDDVAPQVDATSKSVDCGFSGATVDLALCARLPLYISDDGGTTYGKLVTTAGHSNEFTLRLPKQPQNGAGALDVIDPTGQAIDGHQRLELPDATDLAAAIKSHLIDLTRIDGIDSFLNLLQQSLQTASFGGKLPLVGDDLQQGADFIGKLKATIDAALGDLASVDTVKGVRDWVNDKLADGLTAAGLNPELVHVDTRCSTTLASVDAPSVTLADAADAGSTKYQYEIVSYITDSSGQQLDAKPGAPGSIDNGPAAKADNVSPSKPLVISWTSVDPSASYKVYRLDGGSPKLLADVGTATSFTDDGTKTAGAAPSNTSGDNPFLTDCAFSDLDSVLVRLDVSKGDFSGDDLKCTGLTDSHQCLSNKVPLDIGIPGLSLKAATPGDGPEYELGWRLHLAFGISRSKGFFVDTKDGDPQPEFAVGLNFKLPDTIKAQLGFINVTASNCVKSDSTDCDSSAPASPKPLFGGSFKIDITSPHSDGLLTLSDLTSGDLSSFVDVKLHAAVDIDLLLKATAGDDAGFPGIQAELQLKWAFDNVDLKTVDGSGLTVAFQKVQIDPGQVLDKIVGPILREVKKVTGPLDPIIKTLYAPIPVLSDLSHLVGGDDITLVSIAKAYSTLAGGPDLTFVDRVLKLAKVINDLPTDNNVLIPIGSFTLAGKKALSNSATPDNTENLIATKTVAKDPDDASSPINVLDALDSHSTNGKHVLNGSGENVATKAGFSFPVFEHPSSLFNLLLGGDVDLVKFDSGKLALGFNWRQEFGPVYAPPPVLITLHGSASVSMHIVAGFDTYGIRKAIEAARDGKFSASSVGDAILQSLYFDTTDDKGKTIPVVSFTGELAAGAEVSAVIISVGVEGGVSLTVSFLWNDPNHDGKFRISEFLAAALNNPICLFSVSGKLSVFLKLYVQIGFGPFSVSFDFTIVDATLLDFSATPDCSPPPPKTAALGDGGQTLVVYAAALGDAVHRGDSNWDSNNEDKDTVKITSLHNYDVPGTPFTGVAVEMLGVRNEFLNANIKRVVVDGRGYTHAMSVTFVGDGKEDTASTGSKPPTMSFEKDAIVFGGTKNDQIKTGIGDSYVDGGAGDDTIVTGDRTVLTQDDTTKAYSYVNNTAKAWVAGGAGNDSITVGNGDDRVSGDGTLTTGPNRDVTGLKELKNSSDTSKNVVSGNPTETPPWGDSITLPDWTQLPEPKAAVSGDQGNDVISAGLGASSLFGNGGNDTLSIAADSQLAAGHQDQLELFVSAGATLVGGAGNDSIAGGSGADKITTGPDAGGLTSDPDAAGGSDAGAVNVVDTGTGNDTVWGSTGVDRVTGHSTATQHDDIRGGAGEDILLGGYGADRVFGGPDDDYVIAEPSTVDLGSGTPAQDGTFGPLYKVTHLPLPANTEASAKTLVGGTGDDHIVGGDGGASIDGDGYNPATRCGPGAATASDPVSESVNTAQDGNDKIVGGAGVENVRAGGGDDLVDANGGADLVCGERGSDALHGDEGNDRAWGGTGPDVVFGGTGTDSLYGNDGNDSLYGGDQNDTIEGNDGADFASGGSGDDVVLGGTQLAGRTDQGDNLSGDVGDDTIIGDNGTIVGGSWEPLDLDGANPAAGGKDLVSGGDGDDIGYGGIDADTMSGGAGNDHLEGNGGADAVNGDDGEDELIGGGSQRPTDGVGYPDGSDAVHGGTGADLIAGDNAIVSTGAAGIGVDTMQGRGFTAGHLVTLLDLGYAPVVGTSDGDHLYGEAGTDVLYGQGGNDVVAAGTEDDYAEGGPGADTINGDAGEDDLVGGSSVQFTDGVGQPDAGDVIHGDAGADVIIGDNGKALRIGDPSPLTDRAGMSAARRIVLDDLGSAPHAGSSGDDVVTGDDGTDVVLGQGGNDRLAGNADDDYVEGDRGSDWVEGDGGNDDLVGGSSTPQSGSGNATVGQPDTSDAVYGGPGDDAIIGDNALLLRTGDRTRTFDRLSADGKRVASRNLTLYDLGTDFLTTPAADLFGDDRLSGGSGIDVMYGQDGADQLSGGADADYLEGNGGADILRGDRLLDEAPTSAGEAQTSPLTTGWPGSAGAFEDLEGSGADGQDDLIGGSSLANFRDGGDNLAGDGASDFQLGDNGVLQREIEGSAAPLTERVYTQRYADDAPLPADATVVRVGADSVNPNGTTRFCTTAQTTCEKAGAFGDDVMSGDAGADTMWGQDGADTMRGGSGDDDMYGELGDDRMWGEDGNDAMLGDRGGVVDRYEDGSRAFSVDVNQVPKVHYDGFVAGTLTRQTDLQHDIDGDAFAGSSTSAAMAHPGDAEGGNDQMRGGNGSDALHGGHGDDLINGDSGGDTVFGDDGADVIWGGKGCDAAVDTQAASPDCYTGGAFDANARGNNERMVDYLFGGKGATSGPSVDPVTGAQGSDVIDWRPRGSFGEPGPSTCTNQPWPQTFGATQTSAGTTVDPCSWFQMTDLDNADEADNQHHQGTDWEYGGWDRDVLQADVAQNGPNDGDRLLDWNGAFNLYTHCNSAYGGYNDVRQHSPSWQSFLQQWAYSVGAGQEASDVSNGSSGIGTSAFDELALVYAGSDNDHGAGQAYPGTPGHFDDPNACAP